MLYPAWILTLSTAVPQLISTSSPKPNKKIQRYHPCALRHLFVSKMCNYHFALVLSDTSTATPRPYVPPSYRRLVFDNLHSLSHPGIRATQHLVTERFVWPGINKDIHEWTRSCQKCQQAKIHHHTTSPLGTFLTPDARFDQLDIVGPLPRSQGYRYLLTIIDRFTRWLNNTLHHSHAWKRTNYQHRPSQISIPRHRPTSLT